MRRFGHYTLRRRASAGTGHQPMMAMILVGRNGTSGVGTESAFHAATELAGTYDAEVVVVDLASLPEARPPNRRGDETDPAARVASIESHDELHDEDGRCTDGDRPGEDVYDRTISQVSGWFFTPPYG